MDDGSLWTVGGGGSVQWHVRDGTYVKITSEYGLAENHVTSLAASRVMACRPQVARQAYESPISRFFQPTGHHSIELVSMIVFGNRNP